MKNISWNTEKALDAFEDELKNIEYLLKKTDDNDDIYWDDNNKEEECENMWKLWDKFKIALEDEFGMRL